MAVNIAKLIRQKAQNVAISWDELMRSRECRTYLETLVSSISKRVHNPVRLILAWEDPKGPIAWTDNNVIHLNVNNFMQEQMSGLLNRFKLILGILFHELAHVRFSNFSRSSELLEQLKNGQFPVAPPDGPEKDVQAMQKALEKPLMQRFFIKLYHDLENYVADTHDENCLIAEYAVHRTGAKSSLVEQGIMRARMCLEATSQTIDEIIEISEMKGDALSPTMSMLFQYIRFGHLLIKDDDITSHPLIVSFPEYIKDADIAVQTDSTDEMFMALNRIVVRMWPMIQQKLDDAQNQQAQQSSDESQGESGESQEGESGSSGQSSSGQGQSSSSSSNGSSGSSSDNLMNALDRLLDAIAQAEAGASQTQTPKDQKNDPSLQKSEDGQKEGKDQSDSSSGDNPRKEEKEASSSSGEKDQDSSNLDGQGLSSDKQDDKDGESDKDTSSGEGKKEQESDSGDELKDSSESGSAEKSESKGSDGEGEDGQKPVPSQKKPELGDDGDDAGDGSDTDGENGENGDDRVASALNALLDALQTAKAESSVQNEMTDAMRDLIRKADFGSIHRGIPVHFIPAHAPTSHETDVFNELIKEIKSYSSRIQRNLKQELEMHARGMVQRHRPFGRGLDARDAYRPDQLFFTNKKQPNDLPEMAVAVLIDMSGSMSIGGRIEAATRMAVLVQDFCRGMNIPILITGHHSVDYRAVSYHVFSDFDEINPKNRAKVAQLCTDGNNRDGLALAITTELLSKRPEEIKMLFIISDGLPYHQNYSGKPARDDIKAIVKEASKKGIEVIAAAIGDDRNGIRDIYGDSFLDISDLSKLPKTLVTIIKRKIQSLIS